MAWFGGKKKKAKKSPPVLEPVGNPAVPAVQAAPAEDVQLGPPAEPAGRVPAGTLADLLAAQHPDRHYNNI